MQHVCWVLWISNGIWHAVSCIDTWPQMFNHQADDYYTTTMSRLGNQVNASGSQEFPKISFKMKKETNNGEEINHVIQL